jgi:hypothetical protein
MNTPIGLWHVDVSQAPKDHPDLTGTVDDIRRKLADPNFIRAACVHECAHALYWNRIGVTTRPDYQVRVSMGSDGKTCTVHWASQILDTSAIDGSATGLDVGKAHAAGIVAAEIIFDSRYDRGDFEDRAAFDRDMRLQPGTWPQARLDASWQESCEEFRKDLAAPGSDIQAQIERQAILFEREYREFGRRR